MEYIAVCSNDAIEPLSPVFVDPKPHANPQYAHIINVKTTKSETFLGIAISGVKKGDMSSVLASGLFKISDSAANRNLYNFGEHWITVKGSDTIVGSVVHTAPDVDEDGECKVYVVSIMPWANYLTIVTTSKVGDFSGIKRDFVSNCIAKIVQLKEVNDKTIKDVLKEHFDRLLEKVIASATFKWQ